MDLPGPVPRLIASAEELAAHPVVDPGVLALTPPTPGPGARGSETSRGAQTPRDDQTARDVDGTGDGLRADGQADRNGVGSNGVGNNGATCTPAQMRRFIKSRPWVPLHELRRRFQIEGTEDDVVGIDLFPRLVFVGLPAREGQILGDLLRSGEIGYELSLDPATPIVIGVYPMRPVVRS